MSAFIYLEGGATGANSKYLDIICRKAFHELLKRMGGIRRSPSLIPCGGRDDVFKRFKTALRNRGDNYIAMWIDSEEPMTSIEATWAHLGSVTTVAAWERPDGVSDDQVLFMTTCMETWIIADRECLRKHYKQELNENPLPHTKDLESRERHAVQQALKTATRSCSNAYAKGKRSFEILQELDPTILKQYLPSFARVDRILKSKL